jgi:ribosome-binding protein aMBF1 (putative translation factor)
MKKRAKSSEASDSPLTREIRQAIQDDGRSLYSIAQSAGIDEAALRRFISRERSLTLGSADALASELGLKLVRKSKSRNAKSNQSDQKTFDQGSGTSSPENEE